MRKRMRLILAPTITMMLILQSLMPGVWAENEQMVDNADTAAPTEVIETPAQNEPANDPPAEPAPTDPPAEPVPTEPEPTQEPAPTDVPAEPEPTAEPETVYISLADPLRDETRFKSATCDTAPFLNLNPLRDLSQVEKVEISDEWGNVNHHFDLNAAAGSTVWIKVTFWEYHALDSVNSFHEWNVGPGEREAMLKVEFAPAPTEEDCTTRLALPDPTLTIDESGDAAPTIELAHIQQIPGVEAVVVDGDVVAGDDVDVRATFEHRNALDTTAGTDWQEDANGDALFTLSIPEEEATDEDDATEEATTPEDDAIEDGDQTGEGDATTDVSTPDAEVGNDVDEAAGTPQAEIEDETTDVVGTPEAVTLTQVTLPAPELLVNEEAGEEPVVVTDEIEVIEGVELVTVEEAEPATEGPSLMSASADQDEPEVVEIEVTFNEGSTLDEEASPDWELRESGTAFTTFQLPASDSGFQIQQTTGLQPGITGLEVQVISPDEDNPDMVSGVTDGEDSINIRLTYNAIEAVEGEGVQPGDGFSFFVEGFADLNYEVSESDPLYLLDLNEDPVGIAWIDADGTGHVRFTDEVVDENGNFPPGVSGEIWIDGITDWAADVQLVEEDNEIDFSVSTPTGPAEGRVIVPGSPAPEPGEPGVTPTKSGEFLNGDEGRVVHDGAIEWTIRAPAGGPTSQVIMTDTVPEGANWRFACDENSADFDLVGVDSIENGEAGIQVECTPTEITITISDYEAPSVDETPGVIIRANVVDTINTGDEPHLEHLVFNNTVSSVTYGEDGEPINPEGTNARTSLTQRQIGTGADPAKWGEWNVDDHARNRAPGVPSEPGAISWFIQVPSGPSDGVVLTDTQLEGWTFDCDASPNSGVTKVGGVDVDWSANCDNGTVTITVGAYEAFLPGELPVFEIEGTVIASQPDPEQFPRRPIDPLNNTVTSLFTPRDGGAPVEGSASDQIVQTMPPAPDVDPEKSGGFVYRDNGQIRTEDAIQWEIALPAGPNGAVELTDPVPEGQGWEFSCPPVSVDVSGVTFWSPEDEALTEIVCEADELSVYFPNGYEAGQPVITVNANVTADFEDGAIYSNTAFTRVLDYLVDGDWGDEAGWNEGSHTHSDEQELFQGGTGTRAERGLFQVSIGDYVWYDLDRDGLQGDDEPAVAGIQVTLIDVEGDEPDRTTTTDQNGYYYFLNLDSDAPYRLVFEKPTDPFNGQSDWEWTTQNVDGDDDVNSNAPDDWNPDNSNVDADGVINFWSPTIGYNQSLVEGGRDADQPTLDAGLIPVVSVGNYVWYDNDRDGLQDTDGGDDVPASGIEVHLYEEDGTWVASTETGTDGYYVFTGLVPGDDYSLHFDRPQNHLWTIQSEDMDSENTSKVDREGETEGRVSFTAPTEGANSAEPLEADNPRLDAGLIPVVSIGDRVWYDWNDNGVQDDGEAGVPGTTVSLYEDGDLENPIATFETGDDGYYWFTDLDPETTYHVHFAPPTNFVWDWTETGAGDDAAADSNADAEGWATVITPGPTGDNEGGANVTDDPTIDAGIVPRVSIGDYVWIDNNRDGMQNEEARFGVEGVTVELMLDGDVIETTETNAQGYYFFDDLLGNTEYSLQFTHPGEIDGVTGWGWTIQNAGGDAEDSDVDQNGLIASVTTPWTGSNESTPGNADDPTLDAGLIRGVSVGDYVWMDNDRNGEQNDGEQGVPDVTVILYLDGEEVDRTETDETGHYWFTNLIPETEYTIEFVKPVIDGNAGYDWTTQGEGDTTQVANDSDVDEDGLVTFTTPDDGMNQPGGNGATDNPRIDAGLVPVVSMGDYVWIDWDRDGIQNDGDDSGVEGVTVHLLDADRNPVLDENDEPRTTQTDENGYYAFTSLIPDTAYEVQFALPTEIEGGSAWEFTEQGAGDDITVDSNADADGWSGTFTTESGGDNLATPGNSDTPSIDAGIVPLVSIGDYVWIDWNHDGEQNDGDDAGVEGVTVTLYQIVDGDQVEVGETLTDGSGYYSFTDLEPGDYQVQFQLPTDDDGNVLVLETNGWDWTEPGEGTEDTDSNVIDEAGWTDVFSTPQTGNNSGEQGEADQPTIDAGIVPLVSVGDYVWFDLNRDGFQDDGETGVPGVTVTLLDAEGNPVEGVPSTTTNDQGYYAFTDLQPGDYQVQFDLPETINDFSGWTFTEQQASDDNEAENDSNPDASGRTPTFSTPEFGDNSGDPESADNQSIDAGIIPVVSIGDRVWLDQDRDGQQGDGEPGVGGVTVTLYLDGEPVDNTVTDDEGYYWFTDLEPNTEYEIRFTGEPEGHNWTERNQGDPETDSNVFSNGWTGGFTTPENGSNLGGTPDISDDATIDAGLVTVVSIGNYVWLDENRDGMQDDGEPAVSGIRVTIESVGTDVDDPAHLPGRSVVTNNFGYYSFDDLVPGQEYLLTFELPTSGDDEPGYAWTDQWAANDGNRDEIDGDSDVDRETGQVSVFAPDSGRNLSEPEFVDDPSWDAGLIHSVSIGDQVWIDWDRNGEQNDGDDSGVPGVTVTLFDEDGNQVGEPTVTDGEGYYWFQDLVPGAEYSLEFSLPADGVLDHQGWNWTEQTGDWDDPLNSDVNADGVITSFTAPTVGNNQPGGNGATDNPRLDAGIVPVYSVGDYVWFDTNNDGIQDEGELPAEAVLVTLLDANGDQVGEPVTTDANGHYFFTDLEPGATYTLEFEALDGYIWTHANVDTEPTDEFDSDVEVDHYLDSIGTVTFTIPADALGDNRPTAEEDYVVDMADNPTFDGGLVQLVSVGDYVWFDYDQDGVQDTHDREFPVEGVTVRLYEDDGETPVTDSEGNPRVTTTDENGNYIFENLFPNTDYVLVFDYTDTEGDYDGWTVQGEGDEATGSDVNDAGRVDFTSPPAPTDGDGPDKPTLDAGLVINTVSIGDYVWFDTNLDGIQDDGEPAAAGIPITLYRVGETEPVGETETNDDGFYWFTGLEQGEDYYLVFEAPENFSWTLVEQGDDESLDSNVVTENLSDREGRIDFTSPEYGANMPWGDEYDGDEILADDPTLDGGLVQLVSVGDYVWFDYDQNGLQGGDNDGPVAEVPVRLLEVDPETGATVEIQNTTTDGDGFYSFTNLYPNRDYIIEFDIPEGYDGWTEQYQETGEDTDWSDPSTWNENDSNVDPETSQIEFTTPLTGENDATNPDNNTLDAGLIIERVSIGDIVWDDENRDGIQDPGEPGVPGVTVRITGPDGFEDETETDENGRYFFKDLLPNTEYEIEFEKPDGYAGWTTQGEGDEDPTDPTTWNNEDSNVDPETGRTTVTTPPYGDNMVRSEQPDNPTIDAGLIRLISVGDYVWYDYDRDGIQDADEDPVAGVTVTLYDAEGNQVGEPTQTDADGYYFFQDLIPETEYSVTFDLPEGYTEWTTPGAGDDEAVDSNVDADGTYTFTTPRHGNNLIGPDETDDPTIDAGVVIKVSIGDFVWDDEDRNGIQDPGEPGVPGVTVIIYGPDGEEVDRTTTDEDGYYSFPDLFPDTEYEIEFEKPDGYSGWTPPGAGDDPNRDSNVNPETGRTRVTTPSTGNNRTAPGEADDPSIDAGLVRLISVGDYVWYDVDRDGIQGENEPPVAGVVVTITGPDGFTATTTTDENGYYYFEDLIPETEYTITFEKPDGYTEWTVQGAGNDEAVDSNVDASGTYTFTTPRNGNNLIGPGEADDPTIDAGLVIKVSVGDYVWYDTNKNGIQDPGEPPAAGIVVHLYEGERLVGTTTTDENGYYHFQDLFPDTEYILVFEKPEGYDWTVPGAGNDPALDSNADIFGIVQFTTPSTGNNLIGPDMTDLPTLDAGLAEVDPEDPVDPATPVPTDPEKKPDPIKVLPSTGSGSESTGLGLMLASIAGLMLAAVGLRLNAWKRS